MAPLVQEGVMLRGPDVGLAVSESHQLTVAGREEEDLEGEKRWTKVKISQEEEMLRQRKKRVRIAGDQ